MDATVFPLLICRIMCTHTRTHTRQNSPFFVAFKGELSDSFTNYNNVGNTKVSVSIKKNLCQQMHIKRDIIN